MLYVLDTYRYFVRYNDVFFFILYLLSTILCLSHLSWFISLIGYFCKTIRFIISHNLCMIMYEPVSRILIKTKQKNSYKILIDTNTWFSQFSIQLKSIFFFFFYKNRISLTWSVRWLFEVCDSSHSQFNTRTHACTYTRIHTYIHDRECVNIVDISTNFLSPLVTIVN